MFNVKPIDNDMKKLIVNPLKPLDVKIESFKIPIHHIKSVQHLHLEKEPFRKINIPIHHIKPEYNIKKYPFVKVKDPYLKLYGIKQYFPKSSPNYSAIELGLQNKKIGDLILSKKQEEVGQNNPISLKLKAFDEFKKNFKYSKTTSEDLEKIPVEPAYESESGDDEKLFQTSTLDISETSDDEIVKKILKKTKGKISLEPPPLEISFEESGDEESDNETAMTMTTKDGSVFFENLYMNELDISELEKDDIKIEKKKITDLLNYDNIDSIINNYKRPSLINLLSNINKLKIVDNNDELLYDYELKPLKNKNKSNRTDLVKKIKTFIPDKKATK
jgi:hypothetical protein